jgi:hypothetical protein
MGSIATVSRRAAHEFKKVTIQGKSKQVITGIDIQVEDSYRLST